MKTANEQPDPEVADLLALVSGAVLDAESTEAIDSARDRVLPEHVAVLAGAYDELTTWPSRAALVHLLQDELSDASRRMMQHFLVRSPPDEEGSDQYAIGRIIALCHLERDLDRFAGYLDDEAAVQAGRVRWTAEM